MNTLLFCVVLLITSISGAECSSTEQQLVGRWERVEHQPDYTQTVIGLTFINDGRYVWQFRGKAPVFTGRWRLDGQKLIMTVETQAEDSGLPRLPRQMRYKIVRVTEHELVIDDGKGPGRWIRVQDTRM